MYILASKSPRRQELLSRVVDGFSVDVVDTEEVFDSSKSMGEAIEEVAKQKGLAVFDRHKEDTVISADTIVTLDHVLYGKPKDADDAKRMLHELSGKTHEVITGVCLMRKDKVETFHVVAKVTFFTLSDKEIDEYVASGEPLDKAGAYGIQGLGGLLIESIEGDYYSIMGLPIATLKRKLAEFEA